MLISKIQSKPNFELIFVKLSKFKIFRPLRQKFHPLSVAIWLKFDSLCPPRLFVCGAWLLWIRWLRSAFLTARWILLVLNVYVFLTKFVANFDGTLFSLLSCRSNT